MPRFVLLYHECPPAYERASHWDLMLEAGESLRTWALFQLPQEWQAAQSYTASLVPTCTAPSTENIVGAELLGDHRRDYLEYEGPVSGQRGQVTRIDAGTYETHSESPQHWTIELSGRSLQGTATLTADYAENWTLTLETSN
ncbi:MAG TPA: DNA polymerase ligase N-terminal domain-containing protein [Lacipirellulaceae bacterium]|jgi:hypothetical protein|nr:DNA polymerase ligase N-terminal domain-containing protein [Lacipirellulaceae bacterium]